MMQIHHLIKGCQNLCSYLQSWVNSLCGVCAALSKQELLSLTPYRYTTGQDRWVKQVHLLLADSLGIILPLAINLGQPLRN